MSFITPEQVLQIDRKNNKWFLHGRELTKGEVDNLKSEAELITRTALWKLLVSGAKYYVQVRVVEEAKTLKEVNQAQEYYRVLKTFETFLQDINR